MPFIKVRTSFWLSSSTNSWPIYIFIATTIKTSGCTLCRNKVTMNSVPSNIRPFFERIWQSLSLFLVARPQFPKLKHIWLGKISKSKLDPSLIAALICAYYFSNFSVSCTISIKILLNAIYSVCFLKFLES